jgi:hypothetical protein
MYDFRDAGFFPKYYLDDRFTITANNKSGRRQLVNLFFPFPPIPDVTVTSDSLSMIGLASRIVAEPFKVRSIKITAPEEQMDNLLKLTYRDAAGKYQQTVFTPSEYANSFMSQKNRIDIPNLNLTLDVNSSLEVVLNPMTKMSVVFMGLQGANDAQTYQNFMMMSEERGYRNFMKTVC